MRCLSYSCITCDCPAFIQAALKSAAIIVERLLDRERNANGGKYPESIALVLWGTDNIKTYGESLAQVRKRGTSTTAKMTQHNAIQHACVHVMALRTV